MNRDEIRTAGLLFGEELALGLTEPPALKTAEVQRAVRASPVPSAFSRRYQRRQMRRGRLTQARHVLEPLMAARRSVLGDSAPGRPKLLVRLDAFPALDAWEHPRTEPVEAAHAILRDAGVPYLLSVTPRVARRPLDPSADGWREHDPAEHAALAQLRRDGVAFGAHGLDCRTRSAKTSKRSELGGRRRKLVEERLDAALATLREAALHADVLVPPYDRFDAACWPAFASRFEVVSGGPQSVDTFGFHRGPSWRGNAVWLPAYPPLHGAAADVLPAVRALARDEVGLWIPVVLSLAHEAQDGFAALRALAAVLGTEELARPWDDFLLAVRASKQLALALDA